MASKLAKDLALAYPVRNFESKIGVKKLKNLEGYWGLIPGFFHDWKNLLQFAEILQHRDASLGACVNYSAFADSSLFHQVLLDEKVEVLLKNTAVDVGFVHNMCQL
jgi:hypothetical protein